MSETVAPAAAPNVSGSAILRRLGGLAMDIALLALFLALGVAVLDIFVKLIVLIVGYAQSAQMNSFERQLTGWDPDRHMDDWSGLGLTLLCAAALTVFFIGGLRLRRFLLSRIIDASFETFVSKRYLLSREGGSLVNLITVVSVLGVTVGVMALIVVISVMNGFDQTLVKRMMGVFAHLDIRPDSRYGRVDFDQEEYQAILQRLDEYDEIRGASPVVRIQTAFQSEAGISPRKHGAMLMGIDYEREQDVTSLTDPDSLVAGAGNPGRNEVVLGVQLARNLNSVSVGDRIWALGDLISTGRGATPKLIPLKVIGIFNSGIYDVDVNIAYTNLETAQRLRIIHTEEGPQLAKGRVSSIHLTLKNVQQVDRLQHELMQDFPRGVLITTWKDINPQFFEALWVEKVAMFIILMLIVLVASLNIIGTLIMVVTQKTREIGILKSMGSSKLMIGRIFFFHGLFIGIVGTSLGTACGLWLCRFVERDIQKIFQMPAAIYGLDRLPVVIDPTVILLLAGCSLFVCVAAGIIPSFRAARLNPVEALRYD